MEDAKSIISPADLEKHIKIHKTTEPLGNLNYMLVKYYIEEVTFLYDVCKKISCQAYVMF